MIVMMIIDILMLAMIDWYFNVGIVHLQSGNIGVGVSKNGTRCCNCYRHIQLPVEEPREKRSRKRKYQPHTKCLVSLAVLNPPEENCSNATSCNRIRWETNGLPGQAQVSKAEEQKFTWWWMDDIGCSGPCIFETQIQSLQNLPGTQTLSLVGHFQSIEHHEQGWSLKDGAKGPEIKFLASLSLWSSQCDWLTNWLTGVTARRWYEMDKVQCLPC